MTDVTTLIKQCRDLGATFTATGKRLHIQAPEPLPDDVVATLKTVKAQVLAELDKERRDSPDCWVLEEWRRVSIPQWRRILGESIEQRDRKREEYARWMLRDILLDSEYENSETRHR